MNQKKIILYNPATSSTNMGDHIIAEGIYSQLQPILDDAFVVEISTHLPVSDYIEYLNDFSLRFVCGSNLLKGRVNTAFRQWDINLLNSKKIGPCILVGVGWWQGDEPINLYTKMLYKSVLSKEYIHSVRDSLTESKLREIGITNVINTSCPTMWGLTKEHCHKIPTKKAPAVVTTLTDYRKDATRDRKMIEILREEYDSVYLWLQSPYDLEYYTSLGFSNDTVKIISSGIKHLNSILRENVDYIGTRLHAGIRALQYQKRSIIIGIDNRATLKQRDFNIVCLPQEKIDDLALLINSEFSTQINIPIENIELWKRQFIRK